MIDSLTPRPQAISTWQIFVGLAPSFAGDLDKATSEDVAAARRCGVYRDADHPEHLMLRVRTPGGRLSAAQLETISRLVDRHGNGMAELTTRQCIQLHGIALSSLPAVYADLDAAGLTSLGAGGSTLVNMTGCPVSGLDPDELFDCRGVYDDLSVELRRDVGLGALPRKLKLSVTSCAGRCCVPELNCISFSAIRVPIAHGAGTEAFDVRVGGGLGASPRLGRSLGVLVTRADVIPVARALIAMWMEFAPRQHSVARARLKWMVDAYGVDDIARRLDALLDRQLERLDIPADRSPATDHMAIIRQKDGRYYLGIRLVDGQITTEQSLAVARLAESCGADIRLTTQQNLIVAHIASGDVESVRDALARAGLAVPGSAAGALGTACSGQPFCPFAVAPSKPMLRRIVDRLQGRYGSVAGMLSLSVDACPRSCAQHWIADIGLQAARVRVNEQGDRRDVYTIYLGGRRDAPMALGHAVIRCVPADSVPQCVDNFVGAYLRERADGQSFSDFAARKSDEELAAIAGESDLS